METKVVGELIRLLGEEKIKQNEPLKNHTSFKIGGCCDCLVLPNTSDELFKVIKLIKETDSPYFVMGNGSNLLVKDKGIRGFVIKTENIADYNVSDDEVTASAGILLSNLANVCYENELTGFEFASGIPGTLGGAVFMNAGAYDGEMSHVILETSYITRDGNVETIKGTEHGFGYRKSIFQNNDGIILSSKLKLRKGDKNTILAAMQDLNKRRRDKQPLEMPSAGSTFRRPAGHFVGKLVMDCGLMGKAIGGAMVSQKHAGFIVNAGNATASDVLNLISFIQEEVLKKYQVELVPEVKIVGE